VPPLNSRVPTLRLQRGIPQELLPALRPLLALARNLGVGVWGTRGIGKSQLLQLLAWIDFVGFQKPTIVIDPIGAVIDGILNRITHFHPDDQAALWRRIRYVNLSPTDHAVPTPLYYRTGLGRETFVDVAQRLPDVFLRLDPGMKQASVLGYNSLWEIATYAGAILVALGCQPSELSSLLLHPERWQGRLEAAARHHPELREAVAFFTTDYLQMTEGRRRERTTSLRNKLTLLADPVTRAQFCADRPGIDFREVMEDKLLVLYALRFEGDWQLRQFKLLQLVLSWIDFIKRWGASRDGARGTPLSLVIDELSFLTAQAAGAHNPLVDDLDGLINRLSRNFDVHVSVSVQEPYQVPSGMRQTLMSLGTHFVGRLSDPESMRYLADRFVAYDPYLIKKTEPIYMSSFGEAYIVDKRTHEFSLAEQRELTRQRFATLPKYRYLVSRTQREGEAPLPLSDCSIAPFVARRFPPPGLIADVRNQLSRRDGRPVRELVAAIAARATAPAPGAVVEGGQVGRNGHRRSDTALPLHAAAGDHLVTSGNGMVPASSPEPQNRHTGSDKEVVSLTPQPTRPKLKRYTDH
jgi:hypothetical protein